MDTEYEKLYEKRNDVFDKEPWITELVQLSTARGMEEKERKERNQGKTNNKFYNPEFTSKVLQEKEKLRKEEEKKEEKKQDEETRRLAKAYQNKVQRDHEIARILREMAKKEN